MRSKLFTIVALLLITFQVSAQDKIIPFANLPKTAQDFVKAHFDLGDVSYTKLDKALVSKSYEVKFSNGMEVEFDGKGNWKEVDGKKVAIPTKIVPTNIMTYVKKKFPNNEVVQISRDNRRYEVELTNGLDLVFNKKGEFLRIDD